MSNNIALNLWPAAGCHLAKNIFELPESIGEPYRWHDVRHFFNAGTLMDMLPDRPVGIY